jgi:hypothetical protein
MGVYTSKTDIVDVSQTAQSLARSPYIAARDTYPKSEPSLSAPQTGRRLSLLLTTTATATAAATTTTATCTANSLPATSRLREVSPPRRCLGTSRARSYRWPCPCRRRKPRGMRRNVRSEMQVGPQSQHRAFHFPSLFSPPMRPCGRKVFFFVSQNVWL